MTIKMRSNRFTGSTDIGWYYITDTPIVEEDGSWEASLTEDCCPTLDGPQQSLYIVGGNFHGGFRHVHIRRDADGIYHSMGGESAKVLEQLSKIVEAQIAHSAWFAAGNATQVYGGRLTGGIEPRMG